MNYPGAGYTNLQIETGLKSYTQPLSFDRKCKPGK